MKPSHIVIIGAGMSGVNAAKSLVNNHFEGKITLIDEDSSLPYDRPPLSKEFLQGDKEVSDILLYTEKFYNNNNINLKLGTKVEKIQSKSKKITLEDGDFFYWDKLLISTGSKLKHLKSLDIHNFDNIYYLRTQKDSIKLKEKLRSSNHFVIFGAGFIGLEVASSFAIHGKKVTVIEPEDTPLARVLGRDMGEYIANIHRSNGVEVITGDYAVDYEGDSSVQKLTTKQGRIISCDGVLVSIGVEPRLPHIEEGTLKQNNGITVNQYCETSIPDVYASGDCASWPYSAKDNLVRVEHWDHAINQGRCAADNMCQPEPKAYNTIPYFWSDQHRIRFQYLGHPKKWDHTILRGDTENNKFTLFYMLNNTIVGVFIANQPANVLPARRMIGKDVASDPMILCNEDKKLKDIALHALQQ